MYVCLCMYVWMDGWVDASGWMDGCIRMDGWMDACMHMYVCMYGPVSCVPEGVSLGDHTIGGGQERELGGPYHGGGRGQGSGIRTHIWLPLGGEVAKEKNVFFFFFCEPFPSPSPPIYSPPIYIDGLAFFPGSTPVCIYDMDGT